MRLIFLFGVQCMYALNARKYDRDLLRRIDNRRKSADSQAEFLRAILGTHNALDDELKKLKEDEHRIAKFQASEASENNK